MKTKQEILQDFGCPKPQFDEDVTMYYPAILSAMEEHAKEVSVEFNLWINYSETGKKFMWDHFYSSKPVYSILSEAYDIFAKEVGL